MWGMKLRFQLRQDGEDLVVADVPYRMLAR